jgi:hypothetical protein|tara:strand:+ start:1043 stop:1228 length:186 start_codon:yes stop_codon:yes gene_type:complete
MNNMIITNAKYNTDHLTNENCSISCIANGEHVSVPIAVGNRHYDEIKRQVDAGTLTIAAAD